MALRAIVVVDFLAARQGRQAARVGDDIEGRQQFFFGCLGSFGDRFGIGFVRHLLRQGFYQGFDAGFIAFVSGFELGE